MKRRKSTKAVSIAVTIAMMMSLGGYVFADEVEETDAPEETIAEEVPEDEAVEPLEENESMATRGSVKPHSLRAVSAVAIAIYASSSAVGQGITTQSEYTRSPSSPRS